MPDGDDDDDEENVISLNKIKASVNLDGESKEDSDEEAEKLSQNNVKSLVSNVQPCFQPGSTPCYLLSHYMVYYNNNNNKFILCLEISKVNVCMIIIIISLADVE